VNIAISQLTKDYGKFRALDDVNLSIETGMFGLLGPNGAGKTTLMRIITTLLPPTGGHVSVGQYDVMRSPEKIRSLLGYLPQDFGFYRGLNAFELLDYIAVMKNIPSDKRQAQVRRVLEEVNLIHEARRRVGTYSGGLRQRLGIAQALLGDPELLVVDEPTAGLDPEERMRFRNLLARLSGQRTVLLSTHIVADIEASCSGVAVLDRGRLVFCGTPAGLVDLARGRVWSLQIAGEDWESIETRYPILSSRPENGHIQVRLLADEKPHATALPGEPSLEDGYLAVIKGFSTVKEVSYDSRN
jgi:ABC-2 type transport system ATP-binding protein